MNAPLSRTAEASPETAELARLRYELAASKAYRALLDDREYALCKRRIETAVNLFWGPIFDRQESAPLREHMADIAREQELILCEVLASNESELEAFETKAWELVERNR